MSRELFKLYMKQERDSEIHPPRVWKRKWQLQGSQLDLTFFMETNGKQHRRDISLNIHLLPLQTMSAKLLEHQKSLQSLCGRENSTDSIPKICWRTLRASCFNWFAIGVLTGGLMVLSTQIPIPYLSSFSLMLLNTPTLLFAGLVVVLAFAIKTTLNAYVSYQIEQGYQIFKDVLTLSRDELEDKNFCDQLIAGYRKTEPFMGYAKLTELFLQYTWLIPNDIYFKYYMARRSCMLMSPDVNWYSVQPSLLRFEAAWIAQSSDEKFIAKQALYRFWFKSTRRADNDKNTSTLIKLEHLKDFPWDSMRYRIAFVDIYSKLCQCRFYLERGEGKNVLAIFNKIDPYSLVLQTDKDLYLTWKILHKVFLVISNEHIIGEDSDQVVRLRSAQLGFFECGAQNKLSDDRTPFDTLLDPASYVEPAAAL